MRKTFKNKIKDLLSKNKYLCLIIFSILIFLAIVWQGLIIKRIKIPYLVDVEFGQRQSAKETKTDQIKDTKKEEINEKQEASPKINQHTEGNQSPTIVSKGDVNIKIENKDANKKDD